MNKLTIILAIAAGIIIGLIIAYMLKIPFAVILIDTIKAKIASINIGGINIGSIASLASIAGLAATASGYLTQRKEKVEAQTAATQQMLQNQNLGEELSAVTKVKDDFETKLDEATQQKDIALQQLQTTQSELATTKKQLETQMIQTQTLQNINTNTIENLWKNSGSEFYTDPNTGEKFKLLTLVTEKVK